MSSDSSACFERLATSGLDGPLIKVVLEMVWQGKARHKPAWVHMQTGEVQLREGEYWCNNPRLHFSGNVWKVELETYVTGAEVKVLRKLSIENLEAFCLALVSARAAHLDSAITPPEPKAVSVKLRF